MQSVRTTNDSNVLLNEVQAAIVLNLSIRTLQAWRTRCVGPSFVRAGRSVRYRKDDLNTWISANTVLCCGQDSKRVAKGSDVRR
jgi:hypothetical protein